MYYLDSVSHSAVGQWESLCCTNLLSAYIFSNTSSTRFSKIFQMLSTVKGLRFYLTCELKNLACHSFMHSGRRHEIPGSEAKVFTLPGSLSFILLWFHFLPVSRRATRSRCARSGCASVLRTLHIIFILLDSKQTCHWPAGRHKLYFPRLFAM